MTLVSKYMPPWYLAVSPVHPSAIEHIPGGKLGVGPEPTVIIPVDAVNILEKRTGESVWSLPAAPFTVMPAAERGWTSLHGKVVSSGKLRPYQMDGIRRLVAALKTEGGHILADDMGLGKTVQTIAAWQELWQPQLVVVCPASVRPTWRAEFERWAGVTPAVVTSAAQMKKLDVRAPVVITSYQLASKLPSGMVPQMFVLDEAHMLRGRRAERSQALLHLAGAAQYKLALTGTPQWSRPRDWWMLLKILFHYRFGTADQFDYAYCGAKVNQWGGKENKGATRVDELQARIKYIMTRRTKEQVASDLPPLTRVVKWVEPTTEAKRASEAFALGSLRLYDALAATLVAKMDTVVSLVLESGNALIFTWQKEHAYELRKRLLAEDVPTLVITGDQTPEQRQAVIREATAKPGHYSIVATIDSAGTGVNELQHTGIDTVIFHAIDYVPIKMAQAEARLHRIGAARPITAAYVCMSDTVDRHVMDTVVSKLSQWTDVMGQDSLASMGSTLYSSTEVDEQKLLAEIAEAFRGENP